MSKCLLLFAFLTGSGVTVQAKTDYWDLPPISYSDSRPTDKIAKLAEKIVSGELDIKENGLERLKLVLKTLGISPDSQVLVFSKTSLQSRLIGPYQPRCLFFSENAYVGYVPGGAIEVIVQDRLLGPVFYLIDSGQTDRLRIERDTNQCFSCHATSRTENVPGMMIRSVYPDKDGQALLRLGSVEVDHSTPLAERWGGWYVTGTSALSHLGNKVFSEQGEPIHSSGQIDDVREVVDVTKYPVATSDIVALMLLEHQCRIHTLLNAGSLEYRRAYHFGKAVNPDGDPNTGSAGKVADSWSKKIVECMFFKDEADLGEGVEGSSTFQSAFLERFPKTKDGDSLAQFRLYGRIFKNRCSYMIYSEAFAGLPPYLRALVLEKMRRVVAGKNKEVDWISGSERKRISKILSETLPEWN